MSAMRVTVGIPTYNRSGLLKEAMESVLAQTFTDFRLLVSDNASEDDTAQVVRSFGDDRIEYVRSDRNIGPEGNFRRVLELADTELLLILPDDDLLYPDHLRAAVEVLDRYESVGLAHTAFDVIDDRSRVTRSVSPVTRLAGVGQEPGQEALKRLMVADWPIGFSSVVYRTKAIVDAGGIRPEEEPFGDIQLWMRIALDWDFGYIAKPLAGFRVHEATTTSNIGTESGVGSEGPRAAILHEADPVPATDGLPRQRPAGSEDGEPAPGPRHAESPVCRRQHPARRTTHRARPHVSAGRAATCAMAPRRRGLGGNGPRRASPRAARRAG